MSDPPKRPKFWLHRSRRFWGGLVVILMLSALWVASMCFEICMSCDRTGLSISALDHVRFASVGLKRGGAGANFFELGNQSIPLTGSNIWSWKSIEGSKTFQWLPSFNSRRTKIPVHETNITFFLPLWPFPLLWLILWPLWMARADKKEELRFRGLSLTTWPDS